MSIPYHVVKTIAHFNTLVDTMTNARVYTPSSLLYELVHNNYDLTEKIMFIIKKDYMTRTLKSLTNTGRVCNNELRKSCYVFYQNIGWDQQAFFVGYAYVLEAFPHQDNQFVQYLSMIEEGFYTMINEYDFYIFIRNYVEGSIVGKRLMVNLLQTFLSATSHD